MRLQYLLLLTLTLCTLHAQSLAGAATQAATPAGQPSVPAIRATTRSVILDVVVKDPDGRPATGLTRQDFVIREDGIPQTITSFDAIRPDAQPSASTPRTILLIDALNSRFEDMAFTRYAVDRLLHQSGALMDHPTALYVLSNTGLRVAEPYTRSAAALDAALRAVPVELAWRLNNNGPDAMLERINLSTVALEQIASANFGVAGHKNLIWISPGFPLFSTLNLTPQGRKHLADNLRHLSNELLQGRMTIDSVDPRGVIPPPLFDLPLLNRRQQPLQENDLFSAHIDSAADASRTNFMDIAIQTMAHQTGGQLYFGRNDIDVAIADSIRDGGTYYTLSYTPSRHDFHGEFRKVRVDLIHPVSLHPSSLHPSSLRPSSFETRTRDGYYALADDPATQDARRYDELGASLFASLEYRAIPILLTEARHETQPTALTVRLLIPASALTWQPDAQGRFECSLMLAGADRTSGGKWRQSVVMPYHLTLPEGAHPTFEQQASVDFSLPYRNSDQLRFVVQDQATGRIGSSEFTVHKPARAHP